MMPNAGNYNPDPAYLRELLRAAGLTQEQAALKIGVNPRTMRCYLSTTAADKQAAPYVVQYALEGLVGLTTQQPDAGSVSTMMAAMIIAVGGTLRIPRSALNTLHIHDQIQRWDEPSTGDIIFTLESGRRDMPPKGE